MHFPFLNTILNTYVFLPNRQVCLQHAIMQLILLNPAQDANCSLSCWPALTNAKSKLILVPLKWLSSADSPETVGWVTRVNISSSYRKWFCIVPQRLRKEEAARLPLESLFWLHDQLIFRVVGNSYEFHNKHGSLLRPVTIATSSADASWCSGWSLLGSALVSLVSLPPYTYTYTHTHTLLTPQEVWLVPFLYSDTCYWLKDFWQGLSNHVT